MGDIDTEELRRLTAEATPGPWACQEGTPDWTPPIVIVDDGSPVGMYVQIAEMGQGDEQGLRNGALIAAMRNALPALLDAQDAKEAT